MAKYVIIIIIIIIIILKYPSGTLLFNRIHRTVAIAEWTNTGQRTDSLPLGTTREWQ